MWETNPIKLALSGVFEPVSATLSCLSSPASLFPWYPPTLQSVSISSIVNSIIELYKTPAGLCLYGPESYVGR